MMKDKKDKKNITPPATCIAVLIVSVLAIAAAFFACSSNSTDGGKTDPPDTSSSNEYTKADTPGSTGGDDTLQSGNVFINPLTGTETDIDLSRARPIAVMVNNIAQSLPQNGISNADIIYECMTEGLVTRLMLLSSDYEALGTIGSIRSTRPCFLELAMGHDAIIAHAGASTSAYEMISKYGIDNLDGVNMYLPDGVFYRDEKRLETISYEHTMMTSGKGLISGIAYKKYRIDAETGKTAFSFSESDLYQDSISEKEAKSISFSYSDDNTIDYIYDDSKKQYLRYQYSGMPHIDGTNSKQLSFTNVVILNCIHTPLNDAERHIDITLTGTGDGYLLKNGRLYNIIWQKDSEDTALELYYRSDNTSKATSKVTLEPGKTFINIVSESVFKHITIK